MPETFSPPVPPSVGSSANHKPRVLRADFGDGYNQRAADGINTDLEKLSLVWSVLTIAEADLIDSFLSARGGHEKFLWTAPRSSVEKLWVCPDWSRDTVSKAHDSVKASFEQVVL